jgi:hypothetical protein
MPVFAGVHYRVIFGPKRNHSRCFLSRKLKDQLYS